MNSIRSKTQNNNATDSTDTKEVAVKKQDASVATSAKAKKSAKAVSTPATPKAKTIKPAIVELANGEKELKENKLSKKKPKLVRDSFTFPAEEYAQIGILKQRTLKAGHEVKKSELLRAGLALLSASSDVTLLKALTKIDKLKTGRPAK